MHKAIYSNERINCSCGTSFFVSLEEELAEELSGDRYESNMEDDENYTCPTCQRQFKLSVEVTKIVTLSSFELEELGRFISGIDGEKINISMLEGKWIGEEVNKDVSDGIYIAGDREYHILNGLISNVWNLTDENQLTFEEMI